MVTSKDASGNIFLTTENLAFAMPLILLCGGYAYFKFIPLDKGLPALGVVAVLLFISMKMQAKKDEKLQNLDEDTIEDIVNLVGDDDDNTEKEKLAKEKQAKARAQVERRLAAEQRKAEKAAKSNSGKSKKKGGDDDDEDLAAFVKGSRAGKQKKR